MVAMESWFTAEPWSIYYDCISFPALFCFVFPKVVLYFGLFSFLFIYHWFNPKLCLRLCESLLKYSQTHSCFLIISPTRRNLCWNSLVYFNLDWLQTYHTAVILGVPLLPPPHHYPEYSLCHFLALDPLFAGSFVFSLVYFLFWKRVNPPWIYREKGASEIKFCWLE